jgi:hypothetical protein
MTKDDFKKRQRLSPCNLKTGTGMPTPRIVVFEASASLKQRINRPDPAAMRDDFKSGH